MFGIHTTYRQNIPAGFQHSGRNPVLPGNPASFSPVSEPIGIPLIQTCVSWLIEPRKSSSSRSANPGGSVNSSRSQKRPLPRANSGNCSSTQPGTRTLRQSRPGRKLAFCHPCRSPCPADRRTAASSHSAVRIPAVPRSGQTSRRSWSGKRLRDSPAAVTPDKQSGVAWCGS